MLFQLLIIISLVGIFVVLVRRFPQTGTAPAEPLFKWKIPKMAWKLSFDSIRLLPSTLLKVNLPKIALPKISLPKFKANFPKAEKPVLHDEDPLSQADLAFLNRDFELAEKLYIQAVTRHPKDARIYARLGVIYLHQKNYKDARDALLSSLRFDSKVASRHYNLALVYQALGNNQKALVEVKQAIALDATNEKYETLRDKLEG